MMKGKTITGLIICTISMLLIGTLSSCKKHTTPEEEPAAFVRLLEHQSIQSQVLNRTIHYAVLFPKEYEKTTISFPVVYLLHGYGESETGWYKWGNIQYYVDQFAAETIPMIYVMPEGFNTYYVNKYNGNFPYMDMFVDELVPEIDKRFRTVKDAQQRAVMGYSMGGYGAMIMPCKNPGVFKTGISLSMSFRTDPQYIEEPQNVFDIQWAPVFGGVGAVGDQRLTDYFLENSPFHFFNARSASNPEDLNLFIDCGDDEETLGLTNDALHDTLRDLQITHEYRVRNGGHSWDYWHRSLPEALKYIAYSVQRMPYPTDPEPVDPGPPLPADRVVIEQILGLHVFFQVALPSDYSAGTSSYPVILVLHDFTPGSFETESQQVISLLNTNMTDNKLPQSLVVDIPVGTTPVNSVVLQSIIDLVREKYRTINDKNHTVILGNDLAGKVAWELMPDFTASINSCLLFDAALPGNAGPADQGVSYYLDICNNGLNYQSYNSFYLRLRQNNIPYEYRVRQGTPSHQNLLNGLNSACSFIKDHLKNKGL